MKITFKLFAGLSEHLPRGAVQNAVQMEVSTKCSLNDLIKQHQIPRDQVHLILVNGLSKSEIECETSVLEEGDVVAMWPPVAGG